MKAQIDLINGSPTIRNADITKANIALIAGEYDQGLCEKDNGNGTMTITFDSLQDAQNFMDIYNRTATTKARAHFHPKTRQK